MPEIVGRKMIDPQMCPVFDSQGVTLIISDLGQLEFWLNLRLTRAELAELLTQSVKYAKMHRVFDSPPGCNGSSG